jgi:hypothetical protein
VNRLKARSYLIDGEAVASDDNGVAVFARLRRKPSGRHVFLIAFDLLELDAVSEELGCVEGVGEIGGGRLKQKWRPLLKRRTPKLLAVVALLRR